MAADAASFMLSLPVAGVAGVQDYLLGSTNTRSTMVRDAESLNRRDEGRLAHMDYEPRTELGQQYSNKLADVAMGALGRIDPRMIRATMPYIELLNIVEENLPPREAFAFRKAVDASDFAL